MAIGSVSGLFLLLGGNSNNGTNDGAFYGNWNNTASNSNWNNGSRPHLLILYDCISISRLCPCLLTKIVSAVSETATRGAVW